eukprot:859763-Ditylum_brightwellii.AAC.1
MRARSGKVKRKFDGSMVTRKSPRVKGRLDPSFHRKHNLTSSSYPHEFVEFKMGNNLPVIKLGGSVGHIVELLNSSNGIQLSSYDAMHL